MKLERFGFGVTASRVATFLLLSFGASLFEGFGMAMLLPVLEFIEKNQDVAVLMQNSAMWRHLVTAFDFMGLPVGLASLLCAIFGLMMLRIVLTYLRTIYTVWFSQVIMNETRTKVFQAYARADYALYDSMSTGRLLNAVTTETIRYGTYANGLLSIVAVGFVIIVYLSLLLWLSARMTVLATILLGLGGGVVIFCIRHTKKLSIKTTDRNSWLSFLFVELLSAMRLIKLTANTEREIGRVEEASRQVLYYNYSISKLNARVDLILEPVVVFAGLALLFTSITMLGLTLSQVGVFMLVLLRLLPLAKEFLRTFQSVRSVGGSVEEIQRIHSKAVAMQEQGGGSKSIQTLRVGIDCQNVSFNYPEKKEPALKDIDLFIPAGKTTALVGPSGAGKSTFVDMLPALRRPTSGRILFDGEDQREFDLASLRRAMAFVSQDAVVFNDSVRANLQFSSPNASDDEIWAALDKAKAKEFVQAMPDGLDTVLGERGVNLSGGQRQRLSLARAMIRKVPLLILDEPTSALDSETERTVQAAIDDIQADGEVTIIVIAHRLSTIRNADMIVVMENGSVSQYGTHQDLLLSKEWYTRICGMQSAE